MTSTRERLVEINRRNLGHAEHGTIDQADEVGTVAATNYVNPDRFQAEVDRIFKRLPLLMAMSAELPDAGCYKALHAVGVPVLLVRNDDGDVQAFVNSCRHRGAPVVPDGAGSARRFTCPYHGWSYDRTGALVGILDRDQFGAFDIDCHGLVPLPTFERSGLVWASLRPGGGLEADRFLAGFDEVLAHLHLDRAHVVGHNVVAGPNWKVAYDGYMDFYHLPILHKDTFGANFPNKASYDAWGPHLQVSAPDPRFAKYRDQSAAAWPDHTLVNGILTVFPHVSIARFQAEGDTVFMISQLFPGDAVGESTTTQIFALAHEPTDVTRAAAVGQMAFLEHVVRDEDYATGRAVQEGLATGAIDRVLFGRNEGGGQRFHQWVDELLAADDDDLPGLFARSSA
ncbi:MAG: aromatic ring-hydroxylating dioxygenase subunit alpha [Acidimicrobiia bacterium]|nr:aromatic ring-hydroxylating dioxygenase subunit alpha [Acidimicrobiia bacterium]